MTERATDPAYLRDQYGDAEKLAIRQQSHARYSEREVDFQGWILAKLPLAPGVRVIDVGCGNGTCHARLAAAGARVTAVDVSLGMLRPLGVPRAAGDAQALPLRSASFDAGICNHVLYHVPDIERALREIRRVLRPGATAVLATNARDHAHELLRLHDEAARGLGHRVDLGVATRFTLDDLALVRRVFPGAEVQRLENAFRFPEAESALRYYASGFVDDLANPPADASHRAPLLRAVGERIHALVARDGFLRVSKTAGCFVARA